MGIIIEINELRSVTVGRVLRAVGVGDIGERERTHFAQVVSEEVIANSSAGDACRYVDIHIAVVVGTADGHAVRFRAVGDLNSNLRTSWREMASCILGV